MPFEFYICDWLIWINECKENIIWLFIQWHFNYGLKWKLIKFTKGLPNLIISGRP